MLVLNHADVEALLRMPDCIAAMEAAMIRLTEGDFHLPLRLKVRPDTAQNRMAVMPSYRGGAHPLWAIKEVVVTPDNATRGLDPHQGAVLLHDGTTGALAAVVDGTAITAIRTAAVTAVATRALARPGSRTIAILGAGHQAVTHIDAMRAILPDARILIWSRSAAKAEALADKAGIRAVASAGEAVGDADVVCAVTSAADPIIRREWLKAGAHVNAVGSSIPTARELDGDTMANGTLFVDRRDAALSEAGDFVLAVRDGAIGPQHPMVEIGDVLTGRHPGRASAGELTIYKSLGIAIQDLAAAELVLARARESGRGVHVHW